MVTSVNPMRCFTSALGLGWGNSCANNAFEDNSVQKVSITIVFSVFIFYNLSLIFFSKLLIKKGNLSYTQNANKIFLR